MNLSTEIETTIMLPVVGEDITEDEFDVLFRLDVKYAGVYDELEIHDYSITPLGMTRNRVKDGCYQPVPEVLWEHFKKEAERWYEEHEYDVMEWIDEDIQLEKEAYDQDIYDNRMDWKERIDYEN